MDPVSLSLSLSPCSPGSFLVRPSEKVAGDYALAFRTRNEIRHWKIVKNDGKYYVHPRPNSYRSVADIVQVRGMEKEREK